jgi:hypothetical protein
VSAAHAGVRWPQGAGGDVPERDFPRPGLAPRELGAGRVALRQEVVRLPARRFGAPGAILSNPLPGNSAMPVVSRLALVIAALGATIVAHAQAPVARPIPKGTNVRRSCNGLSQ